MGCSADDEDRPKPSQPYAQAFVDRDIDAVVGVLAEDVSFHSPVITEPGFEGKRSVAGQLEIVLEVVTDAGFIVDTGEDDIHVLVTNARVLGRPIEVTTLLESDVNRKIREIWIMARPLVGSWRSPKRSARDSPLEAERVAAQSSEG